MESDRIKSWPVKERPREKLLAEGPEKQTAAELLAIILRVGRGTFKKGVPGQNAQTLARTILNQFGDLRGLDRATIAALLKVPGLSKAKVAQIKAAFELGKRAEPFGLSANLLGGREGLDVLDETIPCFAIDWNFLFQHSDLRVGIRVTRTLKG